MGQCWPADSYIFFCGGGKIIILKRFFLYARESYYQMGREFVNDRLSCTG
jgi:hypothetical protein